MREPKWLKDLFIGSEPETIANPYTGLTETLEPEAVAVYDLIKGAEMFGDYQTLREGLDYFRSKWPNEYMTLLD